MIAVAFLGAAAMTLVATELGVISHLDAGQSVSDLKNHLVAPDS